jgi:ATP-dependent helicase/nuclease subunit A
VLVDEFQDTDEVQAEIVRLLAQILPTSRFALGKLMIVGDPKESIYRFRRARATAFVKMMKEILEDGGSLEHLRENWRALRPWRISIASRIDGWSRKVELSGM